MHEAGTDAGSLADTRAGKAAVFRATASRDNVPAPGRRWRVAAAWSFAGVVLFALFLQISYSGRIDSDGANSALQAWDLIHGHLMLHGWLFGDATFYAFELPLNGVTQLIFGLGPQAAHVASALTYLIIAACAMALAAAGTRGPASAARAAVVVTVLAVPLLTTVTVWTLLEEPDHPGTSVFILVPALLIDRLPAVRRGRSSPAPGPAPAPGPSAASGWRWIAPAVCVILAAGQLGDATVLYVAVPAVALASGYRMVAARRLRCPDAAVMVAAIASVPLERLIREVMTHLGGYQMVAPATAIAPPSRWLGHMPLAWNVLRHLYGAIAEPDTTLGAVGAGLGMACLLAAIAGLARVAWTWRGAVRAEHVLALAVVLNFAAFVVSQSPNGDGYREIAAVLPCGAVLAARFAVPAAIRNGKRALAVAAAAAVIALIPLSAAASRPHAGPALGPAPGGEGAVLTAPLTAWLEAHGVTYGLSNYWNSSIITLESGGTVQVRAIVLMPKAAEASRAPNAGGPVEFRQPYWEVNSLWYDPARHDARYVIAEARGRYAPAVYEKFFGKPAATYPVGGYWVVLQYRVNLLREVLPMLGLDVGPKG